MTDSITERRRAIPRSWMFVPGDKERFLAKVASLDLDAALFDLEDGVLPEHKETARALVARHLGMAGRRTSRYVRLNASTTPWFTGDLDAIVVPGLDGVCLTKVNDPSEVLNAASMLELLELQRGVPLGSVRIVAAIETAQGLLSAPAIARAHSRVSGLIFGAEDFALDLGLATHRSAESAELLHARSSIVTAARAAGILSIDGVFPDLDDEEGVIRDATLARRLGFTSKSTFNPRQIDLLNQIFSPQPEEVAYARKVIAAFREAERRGDASVAVGGQLVDRPIVMRALRTLVEIGEEEPDGD